MSMSTWALLLASSLLGPIIASMLFSSALAKRPHNPGVVVAVAFTLPVLISTLVSWIWFDAFKIDAYDAVGMALIIAGVITLALKQPHVDVRIQ